MAPTLPTLSRRSAGIALAGLLLAVGGIAVLSAAAKPDGGLFGAPPDGESVTVPSTDPPEDDDDGDGDGEGGGGNGKGGGGGNGNGGGGRGNGGGNGNGNGGGGGND